MGKKKKQSMVALMATPPPVHPGVVTSCLGSKHGTGILDLSPWTRVLDDDGTRALCANIRRIMALQQKAAASAVLKGLPFEPPRAIRVLNAKGASRLSPWALTFLAQTAGGGLASISFEGCSGLDDAAVQTIAVSCPHLQELVIDGCKGATAVGLSGAAESIPKLRRLSMHACTSVADLALTRIGACCHMLEELDISGCTAITDHGLRTMASGCSELKVVDVSEGPQVTDNGIISLAKFARGLEVFRLAKPRLAHLVSDDSLAVLGSNCARLKIIDLTSCDRVTDVGIRWLCTGAPGLLSLNVSRCRYVGDKAMLSIGTTCGHLRRLAIAYCKLVSDIGIRSIAMGCPRLEYLDVTGLPLLTDGRLRPVLVSKHLTGVPTKPQLFKALDQYKKADATEVLLDGHEVGLPALMLTCKRLQHFYCGGCETIGDITLRRLASGSGANLVALNLSRTRAVTSKSLVTLLSAAGRTLRFLDVHGCSALDGHAIKAIGQYCHRLVSLNISECSKMPEDGMRYIVLGCTSLTELIMNDVPQLSDIACYHLAITAGATLVAAAAAKEQEKKRRKIKKAKKAIGKEEPMLDEHGNPLPEEEIALRKLEMEARLMALEAGVRFEVDFDGPSNGTTLIPRSLRFDKDNGWSGPGMGSSRVMEELDSPVPGAGASGSTQLTDALDGLRSPGGSQKLASTGAPSPANRSRVASNLSSGFPPPPHSAVSASPSAAPSVHSNSNGNSRLKSAGTASLLHSPTPPTSGPAVATTPLSTSAKLAAKWKMDPAATIAASSPLHVHINRPPEEVDPLHSREASKGAETIRSISDINSALKRQGSTASAFSPDKGSRRSPSPTGTAAGGRTNSTPTSLAAARAGKGPGTAGLGLRVSRQENNRGMDRDDIPQEAHFSTAVRYSAGLGLGLGLETGKHGAAGVGTLLIAAKLARAKALARVASSPLAKMPDGKTHGEVKQFVLDDKVEKQAAVLAKKEAWRRELVAEKNMHVYRGEGGLGIYPPGHPHHNNPHANVDTHAFATTMMTPAERAAADTNKVPIKDFTGHQAATYVFPPDINAATSGGHGGARRSMSMSMLMGGGGGGGGGGAGAGLGSPTGTIASTSLASPMTPQQAQRRGRLDSTSSSAHTGLQVPEGAVQPLSPVHAGGGSGPSMDLGDGSATHGRRSSLKGGAVDSAAPAGPPPPPESGVIDFGPEPTPFSAADGLRGLVPAGEDPTDYELGPLEADLPPIALTMKLKILHMKGCKLVTDTGLSWILQQHTEIRELNVKGSGVTKGSLIAAVHGSDSTSRGPCMLRDDAEWFGIYPRPRADDITREAEYQKQWTASIKIQALMRGFLARKRVLEMREAELKLWLALKLQSIVRGARVRRVVKRERTNQIKKFHAILLIHRAWRRFKARKTIRTGQVKSIREKMASCVLTIQRMWRQMLRFKDEVAAAKADGIEPAASSSSDASTINPNAALDSKALALNSNRVTRDPTTGKRRQRVKYLRREAALDIQRVWRGHRTRQYIPYLRAQIEAYKAKRARSIMLIQIGFLTYISRLRARKRKERRRKAALSIIAWSRRMLARRWRKKEMERQNRGVIAFQKVWRGFVGRCIADEVRAEWEAKRANEASTKIANWFRVRQTLAGLRSSAGIRMALRKGAIDFQRLWRGHRGRKRAFLYKSQRDLARAKRSALLNWAATRLQCFWRKAMAAKMYRVLHEATIPLPLNSLAAGTALERLKEKERNRLTQLATGLGYSLDASAASYYQTGGVSPVAAATMQGFSYPGVPGTDGLAAAASYNPQYYYGSVNSPGATNYSAMASPGGAGGFAPAMAVTGYSPSPQQSPQTTKAVTFGSAGAGAAAAVAVNYGGGPGGNEWSLETDPSTGANYYFNKFTGESRWVGT